MQCQGFSLQEVAEKAEISTGLLSQIEPKCGVVLAATLGLEVEKQEHKLGYRRQLCLRGHETRSHQPVELIWVVMPAVY